MPVGAGWCHRVPVLSGPARARGGARVLGSRARATRTDSARARGVAVVALSSIKRVRWLESAESPLVGPWNLRVPAESPLVRSWNLRVPAESPLVRSWNLRVAAQNPQVSLAGISGPRPGRELVYLPPLLSPTPGAVSS